MAIEDGKCEEQDGQERVLGKDLSRRQFLKVAGVAGAAVGLSAGLGGLITACGGEDTGTATTAGPATTTAPVTTAGPATTAGPTTTVSAGVEMGEEIKVGFVSPRTGPLALFGNPDGYCADRFTEWAADGVVCGDKKKHPIKLLVEDAQSDATRAAQLAGQLVNSGVSAMVATSTPDMVNPVADQCEANGVPCMATDCSWQTFVFGRGGTPDTKFKWTYIYFWGQEDLVADYNVCYKKLPNNGIIGGVWGNDAGGNSYAKNFPPGFEAAGFKVVDTGRYEIGTEDFTKQISMLKKEGCEIVHGLATPPDAENFLKQCWQQSFHPVFMSIDKALLFPEAAEAIGPEIASNLTVGAWWANDWPYTSAILGETCKQFADEYEKRTGQQWTQPLMHFAAFEMVAYLLQNATDPLNREAVIAPVETMKVETVGGVVDFTGAVQAGIAGQVRAHQNAFKSPVTVGQWVPGTTNTFDLKTVDNTSCPEVPVNGTVLSYRQA